jgi:hypothetical protein
LAGSQNYRTTKQKTFKKDSHLGVNWFNKYTGTNLPKKIMFPAMVFMASPLVSLTSGFLFYGVKINWFIHNK